MTPRSPHATTDEQPPGAVERVIAHARAGGLVILPTDTVYGIGALAGDARAVAGVQAAKGRGRRMPPPVLLAGPQQAAQVVRIGQRAAGLMDALWPGALTIVLPAVQGLDWDLGQTRGTLAVRMPDHDLALKVLAGTGPMAVTSANRTGEPPATSAAAAREAFAGRVRDAAGPRGQVAAADIVLLDGGPTPGPVPSTIVSLADPGHPVLLRAGAVPAALIEGLLGEPLSSAPGGDA